MPQLFLREQGQQEPPPPYLSFISWSLGSSISCDMSSQALDLGRRRRRLLRVSRLWILMLCILGSWSWLLAAFPSLTIETLWTMVSWGSEGMAAISLDPLVYPTALKMCKMCVPGSWCHYRFRCNYRFEGRSWASKLPHLLPFSWVILRIIKPHSSSLHAPMAFMLPRIWRKLWI